MIQGLFKLAVRNTLRRGKKSWITVIGVFIGIAAVVALVSLGQGLEQAIVKEFETLGSNQVFVSGDIDDSDLEVVESARGVDRATGSFSRTLVVDFRGQKSRVNVVGADLDEFNTFFAGNPFTLEDGRKLRGSDRTSAMVSSSLPEVYDRDPFLGDQLDLGNSSFRIQGVYSSGDPQFQNSLVVGIGRLRTVLEKEDDLTQIVAIVQPGFEQEEVRNQVEEVMRRDREVEEGEENFNVTIPQDILDTLTSILGIVQAVVVGLASVALLVGGVGIMNTMYMAINERVQEIGVLKAVGASSRDIRLLFLMESGIIGFIGGLIGVIVGIGVSEAAGFLIQRFSDFSVARGYSISLITGALIFASFLGIVSGYLPSRRASGLDPADALNYE